MSAAPGTLATVPAPAGSAPRHRLRARLGGALHRMDPRGRAGLVRLLGLVALLLLIARRSVRLPYAPSLLTCYGLAVLTGTAGLLHLAYTQYDDPAVRTLRRRARGHETFPALPERSKVSFLLAVKDEAGNVEACVRSMAASDYPGLQIIVVDDGSRDGTGEILDGLADELGVTVVRLDRNIGKKAALVRACALADGDVLVFTDSEGHVCAGRPPAPGHGGLGHLPGDRHRGPAERDRDERVGADRVRQPGARHRHGLGDRAAGGRAAGLRASRSASWSRRPGTG
ncbi:glycosyltransferase [Streptomyces sp. NPDC017095]|uniref:glycosyltransferase n=1 Tax=Streptomyces sp. NPDC017095 TaxID=3364977 RepID=UPI00379D7741